MVLTKHSTLERALTALGAATASIWATRLFRTIWFYWLRPNTNLRQRYGLPNNVHSKTLSPWAIVTGASSGIGRALCVELAQEGFSLVLIGRNQTVLNTLAKELQAKNPQMETLVFVLDATEVTEAKLNNLYKLVRSKDIALLIHSAGIVNALSKQEDLSFEFTSQILQVNCMFPVVLTTKLIPLLKQHVSDTNKKAAIVTIGSLTSSCPMPLLSTYAGTKAFEEHWTRSLKYELLDQNIDVLCCRPAQTVTPMLADATSTEQQPNVSLMIPSSTVMAKRIVAVLGNNYSSILPYWPHAFQGFLATVVPENFMGQTVLQSHLEEQKKKTVVEKKRFQKTAMRQKAPSPTATALLLVLVACLGIVQNAHAFLPTSSHLHQQHGFHRKAAIPLRTTDENSMSTAPLTNGDEPPMECEVLLLEENMDSLLPDDEDDFLRESLRQSVIFSNLPEDSLQAMMDAFERVEYQQNDTIIQQGDTCDNDYVYVVGEGQCTVEVDDKMLARPYGILTPKTIFGELAVMYNQTRAATVSCRSPTVTLFRIACQDFKSILNQRIAAVDDENAAEQDQEFEEAIDNAIKEIEGTKSLYDGAIIRPYKPQRSWLWRRFTGTIFQNVGLPTLLSMGWAALFVLGARSHTLPMSQLWSGWGLPPDLTNPFIAKLHMVHKIWSYQQGLTTFILTFFVNQAFSFWRDMYDIGRRIQAGINNFNLILATTAARTKDGASFTEDAESLLEEVGQMSRLFHVLLWAANARRFRVLGTVRGLERMASRGLMTTRQLQVLKKLDLPEDQKHSACLEWMMIRTERGIQDGTLISDPAHRQMLLAEIATLRLTYAKISDKLAGRMPLAYTHFVQILVDVFVWTAPMALYSTLGAWSVICVGVLTLFYTGLMDLAKIFLDPLNNEDFCKNSIYMDIGVLIRESNAGSTRWIRGAAELPF